MRRRGNQEAASAGESEDRRAAAHSVPDAAAGGVRKRTQVSAATRQSGHLHGARECPAGVSIGASRPLDRSNSSLHFTSLTNEYPYFLLSCSVY